MIVERSEERRREREKAKAVVEAERVAEVLNKKKARGGTEIGANEEARGGKEEKRWKRDRSGEMQSNSGLCFVFCLCVY